MTDREGRGMTTVVQARVAELPGHRCVLPELVFHGQMARCAGCRDLARAGCACDTCDLVGRGPHPGWHTPGLVWRPATRWQRLRARLLGG